MMTYDQIRTAVKGFLLDSSMELEGDLDTLIRLGELKIYRELDLRLFRRNAYTALTIGDYEVQLPEEAVVVRDFFVTGIGYLENVPSTYVREVWPDPATSGVPEIYAQFDAVTVIVAPTPADVYQIELTYTYQPPGLSVNNPTTWLSTFAEDLLLYAILTEASVYKQGMIPEGSAAAYRQGYAEAKSRVSLQENMNRSDEYRTRGSI